jgi:hypothetical protein
MAVSHVLDAVTAHLARLVTPTPPLIGGAAPVAEAELPALTLSLTDVRQLGQGIGRRPRSTVEGALHVDVDIDLADAVLRVGSEIVALLSADRGTVVLPHGSIVRADGTTGTPFTTDDLQVSLGATTFVPVAGTPQDGQVGVDAVEGRLSFPAPLPPAGTLRLGYFIGLWDVESEHLQGELVVEVAAADASGVQALARRTEAALSGSAWRAVAGLADLRPLGVGRIDPVAPAGIGRRQTLRYRFDFERETPQVRTSGGAIREIEVATGPFDERFTIIGEETRT